ncbi:dTDP-glucose 4-6-dehydratase-like protein [Cryptosporidium ryanae]|uniref:dTDP-glucose 4-6-dehydratase-like protein n=1 Tax=Cryptosporidium ryanae TaxID=515981 RepID=UPI00351A286A|nr:dTDP-glucose 4-6-dehydratase-like protein [Cryptosporidium ryanae]
MKTKKVLVTGGSGFVGSHIVKYLLDKGYHVISLDNHYSGSKENVEPFLVNPNFEMIEHDIIEPIDLQVDEIYHLACPASPPYYQKSPTYTLKTCFIGTMNILELAKKSNSRVVFASSSEVYGDPLIHPQTEEYFGNVNIVGNRSCYDEGKRVAETLCMDYNKSYGVDVRIARIFNTYGPKMLPNDGRVISNFIVASLKGEKIPIYGDGKQTRSFCYISDTVEALYNLMNLEVKNGSNILPINIGNPVEISIIELAEIINELNGFETPFEFRSIPTDDPKRRKPDISKAIEIIGWTPKIDFKLGLKETISYFKKNFKHTSYEIVYQGEANLL